MLRKIFFYLTIFVIIINFKVYSEIPIIVITPSKKPQSLSTVGTSIQVISEKEIEKSGSFFLAIYYQIVLQVLIFFKVEDRELLLQFNWEDYQRDIPLSI